MSDETAHLAYLGLGSNLDSRYGGPAPTLRAALARLERPRHALGQVLACSSFYETDPVGDRAQPLFVNAAAALETALGAVELLHALLEIEREFGRDRGRAGSKGPRTLDLDLLLFDDLKLISPELTLPHPALAVRRFVLTPLAEIAPGLEIPGFGATAAELLARLPAEGENGPAAVRPAGGGTPLEAPPVVASAPAPPGKGRKTTNG